MRIVLMSATEFGFRCLETLLTMKQEIAAIYTLPKIFKISYSQKPVEIATHRSFKGIAKKHGVPFIEVKKKMKEYEEQIRNFKPDFILVTGWYFIIPKTIRKIPPLGCAGVHASLLPKYRGGAPLTWAIIRGEKKAGVSFFYFEKGVDTGSIIAQKEIPITKKDDIKTLYQRATVAALKILEEHVPLIEKGKVCSRKQDERKATYFPQRNPEDGLINWNRSSLEIYNWIRAQTKPYPGAFFFNDKGEMIRAWASKAPSKIRKLPKGLKKAVKPGVVLNQDKKELKIATKNGYITITDWEIQGSKSKKL